ncbi:anoctamin-6-like [Hetaerina americana]|uniref:anoctamin-6-like n=1 Tax=Hetaerina americana TaxID=62018 RepID=UPI003A7F5A64
MGEGGERKEEEPIKRVDFVLTFDDTNPNEKERNAFEDELRRMRLALHKPKRSKDKRADDVSYLLVYVPFEVMEEYAEKLYIRKPLKEQSRGDNDGATRNKWKRKEPTYHLSPYCKNTSHLFDIPDKETFFTSSERAQVIWHIMRWIDYGKKNELGTNLLKDWARLRKWREKQPLNDIRDYFGEEVALYFAWLGTYTESLVLPAFVGICCFLYGLLQLNASEKKPMEEVCYGEIGLEMMCAHCSDASCSEEELRSTCGTRILLLIFDNLATVFMAIFTSFWAAGFLMHWKRTQARLSLQWGGEAMLSAGGTDRDTWEIRPEYKYPEKKSCQGKKKYSVPRWEKFLTIIASMSVVLFMLAIVVSALKNNSKTLTSFTAAIINLVIIIILKWIYAHVAIWLTNLENPMTQADYDKSYIMKVYVFEFFNCYSSLFYIAFVKGYLYTYPGDPKMSTTSLAQDTCDSGGCMAELLIQLLVIMGGKQLLNLFMEIILPRLGKWMNSHQLVCKTSGNKIECIHDKEEWEKNYHLLPENSITFCQEILEIVIQYGFVTLFVAAFPLAPLFALINNIAEIRVDANKMLTQYRRALPHRIKKLASWDSIQQAITYLAVAVNGCIIAFTSEFIPRLVYANTVSEDQSLAGYINFSLSVYRKNESSGLFYSDEGDNLEYCRYRGFREPPGSENEYSLSSAHWHVLALRLLFVVVFEHVVLGMSGFVAYYITEVPRSVEMKAHEEREETKEITAEISTST